MTTDALLHSKIGRGPLLRAHSNAGCSDGTSAPRRGSRRLRLSQSDTSRESRVCLAHSLRLYERRTGIPLFRFLSVLNRILRPFTARAHHGVFFVACLTSTGCHSHSTLRLLSERFIGARESRGKRHCRAFFSHLGPCVNGSKARSSSALYGRGDWFLFARVFTPRRRAGKRGESKQGDCLSDTDKCALPLLLERIQMGISVRARSSEELI